MANQEQDSNDCITHVRASPMPPTRQPLAVAEPLALEDQTQTRTKIRIYSILAALYLVLFVAALDQTIVATSIPTISNALQSASGYTWIGSAYLLANAAAGPIWSRCSDIWGRKPALLSAVVLFAIASLLAALSVNMRMLIAARALQGTAGAGLKQLVSITISDLFSVRERALYFGLMGFMWAVAGSTGPLIGGALTQLVSWRWCFWINLPVCVIAFMLLLICLGVHNPCTRFIEGIKAIDWIGTFSILTVTLLLLLGLDFGGSIFPWNSPKVISLIVFGSVMIGFFIYSQSRLARYPLMPLALFKNRSNCALFIVTATHSMVSIGGEYYLPLYFQSAKQVSPLRSGILILPMMITTATVDIAVGILVNLKGRYRELIWIGTMLMTLGMGLFINFTADTPIGHVVGFQIIWAAGIALLFQTPMIAIHNTVAQSETASTTSTMGFIGNIATSLSIVLGGVVFQNSMVLRKSVLAAGGLEHQILQALSSDQAAAHVDIVQSIQSTAQRHMVQEAFAWSIRNMWIMYTCIGGIGLVASMFVKHATLRTDHTETKTGIKQLSQRKP